MKIVVTQDDIKTGNRRGCHTCPIALAVLAALGRKRGSRWVSVSSDAVHVGNSPIAIALPARVREFIKSFDSPPDHSAQPVPAVHLRAGPARGGGKGMKTPRELLVEARETIAEPERWCRHAAARTATGRGVTCGDPEATAWCMSGALGMAAIRDMDGGEKSGDELKRHHEAWERATLHLDGACKVLRRAAPYPIMAFNDMAQDHAIVLRAFDLAIEEATA